MRTKIATLQTYENLHKNVNEHSHFYAIFHEFYEEQLKQQICYSFILLISHIVLIHLEWRSSSFRLHQIFPSLMVQMQFPPNSTQGGQPRGQHDWVHGFPESVKSFITFIILNQISCSKVQNPPHIFLHKTVSKFLLGFL